MDKKILIVEDEFIIADVLKDIAGKAGYDVCGIADSVEEALKMVAEHQPDFVMLDIYLKGKSNGIDLANILSTLNIPFIYLSANSDKKILDEAKATNPYGFVVKPFREYDVLVALDIAEYRYTHNREHELRQSLSLQRKIEQIIDTNLDWHEQLVLLGNALQVDLPFDMMSLMLKSSADMEFDDVSLLRVAFEEYQIIGPDELLAMTRISKAELDRLRSVEQPELMRDFIMSSFSMKSHLVLPLYLNNGAVFYFCFYSRRPDVFHEEHTMLFKRLQTLLVSFVKKGFVTAPNDQLNQKAKGAGVLSKNARHFDGIIGKSHLLLNVFDSVLQVAPAETSVLILGETGTGKEKIADRIHFLSPRKSKAFVKINCAALPSSLIEAELFGYEKGAFTNALEARAGKFEQAHQGTIFLDEIGEIPLELQAKLLRVLQEKEIERIGGRKTIKTDVRIIAATNKNLEKEVAEGRFRIDLYYRLNVFPIVMPALRERKEDLPELIAHFLRVFNHKASKSITSVSEWSLQNMLNYNWPGNIRELENVIERNVLMTRTEVIDGISFPGSTEEGDAFSMSITDITTMSENERNHILTALKKCEGKIWGKGGAAELLNLPPTTLNSKMKKLGISKTAWNI